MVWNDDELPYLCPMIEDEVELDPDFIRATHTVWKHLIRDPLIYDLVKADSQVRTEGAVAVTGEPSGDDMAEWIEI